MYNVYICYAQHLILQSFHFILTLIEENLAWRFSLKDVKLSMKDFILFFSWGRTKHDN